jgi:hypothetical protein
MEARAAWGTAGTPTPLALDEVPPRVSPRGRLAPLRTPRLALPGHSTEDALAPASPDGSPRLAGASTDSRISPRVVVTLGFDTAAQAGGPAASELVAAEVRELPAALAVSRRCADHGSASPPVYPPWMNPRAGAAAGTPSAGVAVGRRQPLQTGNRPAWTNVLTSSPRTAAQSDAEEKSPVTTNTTEPPPTRVA